MHSTRMTLVALLALVFAAGRSPADDNTWTNSTGNRIWSNSANNWALAPSYWVNSLVDTAIFTSTGTGTITVVGSLDLRGINFQANGYTINGGTLSLVNYGSSALGIVPGEIRVNTAVSATINSLIAGGVAFTKTGTGTLTLGNGNSTYSGNVNVNAGKLVIAAQPQNGGATSALGASGGTRQINVNNGGTLSFTINNVLPGSSAATMPTINIAQGGQVTSTRFTPLGNVNLSGGVLEQASTDTASTGGSFQGYEFVGSITASGSAFSSIMTTNGSGNHLAGNINFNVTGSGDLYILAPLLNGVSVTGSLVKNGAGTLRFFESNSYAGGTTVNNGTIYVGVGGSTGTLGSGGVSIAANATILFFRNDSLNVSNAFSGSGALTFAGTGVSDQSSYTLSGNNSSFAGVVQLGIAGPSPARLVVSNGNQLGTASVTVNSGSSLFFSGGTFNNTFNVAGNGWTESSGILGAMRFNSANVGGTINLSGNARFTVHSTDAPSTISAKITDGPSTFNLEKSGTGRLTFTGTGNDYSGTTTVSEGTLGFGSQQTSLTGQITVSSGATLRFSAGDVFGGHSTTSGPTIVVNGGSVTNDGAYFNTFQNLTLNGGTLGGTGGYSSSFPSWSVRGTVTSTGSSFVNPSGTMTGFSLGQDGDTTFNVTAGTLTVSTSIIDYVNSAATVAQPGTLIKTGAGTLTLNASSSYSGVTALWNGVLSINSIADAGVGSPMGKGSQIHLGNAAVAPNGTLSYTGPTASSNRNVTLATSASGTIDVTLPNTILTLSGAISGGGRLVKTGPGLLFLTNAGNNYSGGTWINASEVQVTQLAALGTGDIAINGPTAGVKPQAFLAFRSAGGTLSNTITVSDGGGSIASNQNSTYVLSGVISSIGGGTNILNYLGFASASPVFNPTNANNNYSGATVVTNGAVLSIASIANGGLVSPIGSGTQIYIDGATLRYTGGSYSSTNRSIILGSVSVTDAIIEVTNSGLTLSGPISGPGQLVKNGRDFLQITNANVSYSGGTRINDGLIQINDFAQLGSGNLVMAGLQNTTTPSGGAYLTYAGNTASSSKNISLDNYGGGIYLFTPSNTVVTLSGTISSTAGSTRGFTVLGEPSAGNSVVVLSGNNSYTGPTIVDYNGILSIASIAVSGINSPIGSGSQVYLGNAVLGGTGTLRYTGASATTDRSVILGSASSGLIDVASSTSILTFNGQITGSGSLVKIGPGILELGSQNNYTGNTTVSAGTLKNAVANALPQTTNLIVNGGTYDLNGRNQTVGSLSGSGGTVTNSNSSFFPYPFLNVNLAGSSTYTGTISGELNLVKSGSGNLTLGGNNTFKGTTTIDGGSLILEYSGNVLPDGNNITVNTGGILNNGNASFLFTLGTLTLNGGTLTSHGGFTGLMTNQLVVSGSGTSVDLSGGIMVLALTGTNPGVTVNANTTWIGGDGSSLTHFSTTRAFIKIAPGVTVTTSLAISGSTGFRITGGGTLYLNNLIGPSSGEYRVEDGTLRMDLMSQIDQANVTLAGTLFSGSQGTSGRFQYSGSTTSSSKAFSLDDAGGTFNISNAATTLTLAGVLSGSGGLFKTGPGTLIISGASNTYNGGTTVNAGTLSVSSDNVLGASGGEVIVNTLGTFNVSSSFTTSRTFSLNNGKVTTTSGQSLTFNNATVGGGFLVGTFATQAGSSNTFTGTKTNTSSTLTLNGTDTLVNFSHGGQITVAAGNITTSANGFTNEANGRITVGNSTTSGATLTVTDFISYGLINLTSGGTVSAQRNRLTNTSISDMYFGGGSRTFIGSAAAPNANSAFLNLGGKQAIVSGGLLVNNGTVSNGTVVADFGAIVKGAGTFVNPVITQNGGAYAVGNSPGRATNGSFVFNGGGQFIFQINNAVGMPGPVPDGNSQVSGWSLIEVKALNDEDLGITTGAFTVSATAGSKYTIKLQTLQNPTTVGSDNFGPAANFNPNQSYSWAFMTYEGSYTGPSDLNTVLNIDTSQFANVTNGTFSIVNNAAMQTVSIEYAPVPEPGSILCLTALTLGLYRWRRYVGHSEPLQSLSTPG